MRIARLLIALAGFVVVHASAVSAQDTGFLNRSVSVDGGEYRYQVYVPREFRASHALPVILALHGGGQYGKDGLLQTDVGLAQAIRRHVERIPAIVVFPQSQPGGTPGFQALGGRLALAALDKSIAEFNADRTRVYVTGFSMGGNGAWYLAFHHADRFAALVVVCGFVDAFTGTTSGVRYSPIVPGVSDPYGVIAQRVSKLPLWILHGDADQTVSVEQSRRMAAALAKVGADMRYTELPGVPHNAWDPAYERADLFTWLFQQKRR